MPAENGTVVRESHGYGRAYRINEACVCLLEQQVHTILDTRSKPANTQFNAFAEKSQKKCAQKR